MVEIDFVFQGKLAGDGLLESYDAARALVGFQRSLALTAHLMINGEIITHAPSLAGAQILFPALEEGS